MFEAVDVHCARPFHFFVTLLTMSMTFGLFLTQISVLMSLYVMLSILLSIFVCACLFCAGFLTTNLAVCVCVYVCVCVCARAKFYQFLPLRSYFVSKRPENFVRIAKFPYAAFGPLFAFHCPLFFTKNNTLNGVGMLNVTAAH